MWPLSSDRHSSFATFQAFHNTKSVQLQGALPSYPLIRALQMPLEQARSHGSKSAGSTRLPRGGGGSKRENRGAEGVGHWDWCPPPQPTKSRGGRPVAKGAVTPPLNQSVPHSFPRRWDWPVAMSPIVERIVSHRVSNPHHIVWSFTSSFIENITEYFFYESPITTRLSVRCCFCLH